ncbi:hypothetical protein A4H97_01285 [Niastella yeongjuensis]|uniref:Uncharacterized protein n=2 Tax=Niastella yeongjuensis TaxID=354355 RepID=A0A1V9EWS1_9BACT|nr:hypothetical protein A4H97_01285 [Niastella yeongjuensis]
MFRIPTRARSIFFQFIAVFLFITWLILLCIKPVNFFPDSDGYLETANNLGDTSSGRPILFPLLLLITNKLHLKLSLVCYFIEIISLAALFWFCGPRKKLLSSTNFAILIVVLLLPAISSYCGACLTESILFAVEIWMVIFLSFLFFPKQPNSLAKTILYSLVICLLAILLKPWIMVYVVGCSVLFTVIALFTKAFRSARTPALVLLIVTIGSFIFSYRYNMSKSSSSANIVYLMANSDKADDLKARLKESKDTTSKEARFMSLMVEDIELLQAKYNSDPLITPMEELKLLKVNDKAYTDTINHAFKIAYFQRKQDIIKLMGLSVERYIRDTKFGLVCVDFCYGPSIKMLKKNGVYFALAFSFLTLITWFIRQRMKTKFSFRKYLSAMDKQLLIFVGVLLLNSIFFALFLCISGGIELGRTVLPATLFQLAAISYLVINRHKTTVSKQDNTQITQQ